MSSYLHTKHQSRANFELHKVVAAGAGHPSETSRAKMKLLRLVGSVRPLVSQVIQQVLAKDKTRRRSRARRDEKTNFAASTAVLLRVRCATQNASLFIKKTLG